MDYNPYNAPAGGPPARPHAHPFAQAFVPALASVGSRFFARLLDGVLPLGMFFFVFMVPGGPLGRGADDVDPYADVEGDVGERDAFDGRAEDAGFEDEDEAYGDAPLVDEPAFRDELEPPPPPGFPRRLLLLVLLAVGFQILQYYLIATSGQTIGKKLLGIRIVTEDGRPVGFWDGVAKRELFMGVLTSIPFVGGLIGLYDAVSIFSADRRTLHDKIAGTIVVEADSVSARVEPPSYGAQPGFVPPAAPAVGGRFGAPPGPVAQGGYGGPVAAPGLLGEVRSAPITPELARRVDARMQELARSGTCREVLDLYRTAADRRELRLSDRSLLIVEQAAAESGDSEFAVSMVRELMTQHPQSQLIPRAMWDVAVIQQRAGREDLARATLEGLIERFPGDPFALQARDRLGG